MKKFIYKRLREGLMTEQLIFETSDIYLTEAILLLEGDLNSRTFEWDIAKEKIDKSKENITTKSQAERYFNNFLDKISNLPVKVKVKITKYVITSLVGLLGLNAISSMVSSKAPEIKNELAASLPKFQEPVAEPVSVKTPERPSNKLVSFLKYEEGSIKEKGEPVLKAYKLGDGMITIGWGHAEKINNSQFKVGQSISRDEANKLLKSDIKEAYAGLNRLLGRWDKAGIKYEINQGMYDAMVSMIFNMGIGNFLKSEFIQLVKKGNYKEAAEKILTTNVTYKGHVHRRQKEYEMFLSK